MYLQITTRCNMRCDHCCFSCTEKGQDMSLLTVENALRWCSGEQITIGGGEPTLHKNFNDILIRAISEAEGVYVITNGSIKKHALLLARLIKKEVIGGRLSNDEFHDTSMVDDEVYVAFDEIKEAEYQNYSHGLVSAGRAKKNAEWLAPPIKKECACPDLFVCPNGDVYSCGCKKIKLGNINNFDQFCDEYSALCRQLATVGGDAVNLSACARYEPEGRATYNIYRQIKKHG